MLTLNVSPTLLSFQNSQTIGAQQMRDGSVTVSLPRAGASVRRVAELALAKLGLAGQTLANFNAWAKTDFLQDATNQLTRQTVASIIRQATGANITIKITIKASLIKWLQAFGLTFAQAPNGEFSGSGGDISGNATNNIGNDVSNINAKAVEQMTTAEKIAEAIQRAIPMMPAEVGNELKAMLTPETLAVIEVVVAVWAVGHFFVISEIVDIGLIVLGVLAFGAVAWRASGELVEFSTKAVNAKTEDDLNQSAEHFAKVVALIGIQGVMPLIFKGAPKTFNRPFFPPLRIRTQPPAPRTSGSIFYKSKVAPNPNLPPGTLGSTNKYGDIEYLASLTGEAKRLTVLHEKVHSFLTPKLQVLREVRIVLGMNSYSKSFILRYLEEALAETIARVTIQGWREVFGGITFPVKNGYLTIRNPQTLTPRQITTESLANMGKEATGIFLGPVNVGGMLMNVITLTRNRRQSNGRK